MMSIFDTLHPFGYLVPLTRIFNFWIFEVVIENLSIAILPEIAITTYQFKQLHYKEPLLGAAFINQ